MYFTEEEVGKMKMLLKRLEPDAITSIQYFTPANELRTGCPMVINNKYEKPICVLQNYSNLSPFRRKLILRLSKKIPFEIHITQPREDITRIGWKWSK